VPIWTADYRVTSYLMNHHQELSLPGLLSLIQEAAWEHAYQLGYGYAAMELQGLLWALIRQKLSVERWPGWGETVRVRTWLRPPEGLLVTRDFQFFDEQGPFCGGTTAYLMLDRTHRRPAAAPMRAESFYPGERGPDDPQRIAARPGLPALAQIPIRASDLDMHGHVNNTRVGQWLFDTLPSAHRISDYEVDFQSEMHFRETIAVEAGPLGEGRWHLQGRRADDGKIVFAARVGTARS